MVQSNRDRGFLHSAGIILCLSSVQLQRSQYIIIGQISPFTSLLAMKVFLGEEVSCGELIENIVATAGAVVSFVWPAFFGGSCSNWAWNVVCVGTCGH